MATGYRISAKGKEAEIYIYEDVGEGFFGGVSAKGFADDLKKAGKVETINLRINSYGGDVFDGLAIYNLLAAHDARIIAHIDGIAASIASVIAMSADEIRLAENGFIMIHDAWGAAQGNAADMRQFADKLEMVSGAIADVYAKRTGMKRDAIVEMMHAETWMDSTMAMDKGFCTSVCENQKMAAKFDPTKHSFKNRPAALSQPVSGGGEAPSRSPAAAPYPLLEAARARIARMEARRLLNSRTG